jgi:hypothetical protein
VMLSTASARSARLWSFSAIASLRRETKAIIGIASALTMRPGSENSAPVRVQSFQPASASPNAYSRIRGRFESSFRRVARQGKTFSSMKRRRLSASRENTSLSSSNSSGWCSTYAHQRCVSSRNASIAVS